MYHWDDSLHLIQCPNQQVNLLTEVVYNVCCNFIPNESRMIKTCQAPWVTKKIKSVSSEKESYLQVLCQNGRPKDGHDEIQHDF